MSRATTDTSKFIRAPIEYDSKYEQYKMNKEIEKKQNALMRRRSQIFGVDRSPKNEATYQDNFTT